MRLTPRSHPRFRGDTGSALLLMPAGVLVVLVLSAITVDLSLVHLGHKELVHGARAAANDAATFGLAEDRLRATGDLTLDPGRVETAVQESLAARGLLDRLEAPPQITFTGALGVRVRLTRRVDYVFGRALPGDRSAIVTATAEASAQSR